MDEHQGIPPTCGCTDYGVHRALKRLDYERNAGRIAARELGGKYRAEYEQRVARAEAELAVERHLAAQPGRVNPTPGQLLKELREYEAELERMPTEHRGFFRRIRDACVAFFG